MDKDIKGCSFREIFPLEANWKRLLASSWDSPRERETPERPFPCHATQCPQTGLPCGLTLHLTQHSVGWKSGEAMFCNNKIWTDLSLVSLVQKTTEPLDTEASAFAGRAVCFQSGRVLLWLWGWAVTFTFMDYILRHLSLPPFIGNI